MAYGLAISNESGFVQVDDTYANFTTIASGTGSPGVDIFFPAQPRPPVVLITPNSYGVPYEKWGLGTDRFNMRNNGNTGTFTYKVIVPTSDLGVGSSPYGLRVYNSSGGVTFDSGREQFRASRAVTFVPTATSSEMYIDVPADIGTACFTANSTQIFGIYPAGSVGLMYAVLLTQVSATQFRAYIAAVASYPVQASFDMSGQPITIILGTYV